MDIYRFSLLRWVTPMQTVACVSSPPARRPRSFNERAVRDKARIPDSVYYDSLFLNFFLLGKSAGTCRLYCA